MIYFDSAATSLHKPPEVAKAVAHAINSIGSGSRGSHDCTMAANRIVYQTRSIISDMFNVEKPENVIFTFNATESLNVAIQGLLNRGDHCISTLFEHNSVLRPLYHMEKLGLEIDYLSGDKNGMVNIKEIEGLITNKTKAVIIGHGSNVTGNLVDLKKVGDICKEKGLLLIVDAAQTAGLVHIDMQEQNIDALCLSAHKGLLGPQGVGLLCLKSGVLPRPLKFGGTGFDSFSLDMPNSLPEVLEAGTMNIHSISGLLKACEYIKKKTVDEIYNESMYLANMFYEGINKLENLKFYGDMNSKMRTPIVSFNIGDADSATVSDELNYKFEISTRPGAHCAPGVHRFFNTVKQGMVRFSFSHMNTIEEVDVAINAVKVLAGDLS
ncbi:aminotransferase class V-fold PLP-dependent enzyme [Alkalibacter mobilis]|uniref:aminotransferase class V-fold PLP-dependent enzyme n=1 Tax=Alkalibacter mobilis TaxID=2787712 RepID=UPI0018A05091|nr:aminotransferase class V-fold PLP-dependent enzyme [Alkalibacter mobilis]MBF7096469.1 aminotransferase class V-fold PLP-dependent enzyme [Alkalibacter mobilis]